MCEFANKGGEERVEKSKKFCKRNKWMPLGQAGKSQARWDNKFATLLFFKLLELANSWT